MTTVRIREGLTFNDVLIVPQHSDVVSRKTVNLSTRLTRNGEITLSLPIISSNMDTITEDDMAIAMAEAGGLGIIHRFNTIEEQVELVSRVKRFMNYKVADPHVIQMERNSQVEDYHALVRETGVHCFPVVNRDHQVMGMITNRDIDFSSSNDDYLKDIMTPMSELTVCIDGDDVLGEAYSLMKTSKKEKILLVEDLKSMRLSGMITHRDIKRYNEMNKISTLDSMGRLMVGAAIGVREDDMNRAEALIKAGTDILCIDVAHGDHMLCGDMVKAIKACHPDFLVIAGNVATASGVKYLIECGADCIKVGIGCGSICTTRMVTGCGVPQLTALIYCYAEAAKSDTPIISDGGNGGLTGNIAKALGCGASAVMLGNFLAGTDETPGPVLIKDNRRVKYIRGMSGYGANLSRRQKIEKRDDLSDVTPEGIDAYVPHNGPVKDILCKIVGGVSSACSYAGAHDLKNFASNVEFIKVTSAGRQNSDSHGVNKL